MVADEILDTSVLVDLLRGFQPARTGLPFWERQQAAITPVVWMETVAGATNQVKRAQTIRFLRQFRLEHPTEADNRWAMRQLARFHPLHVGPVGHRRSWNLRLCLYRVAFQMV
jgi:predicted nucleic acid-binding protein